MNTYKGKKQYHVNMYFNSSWCLFPFDKSSAVLNSTDYSKYEPIAFTGNKFTFESHEKKILDKTREFGKTFLEDNGEFFFSLSMDLKKALLLEDENDGDLLCRIIRVFSLDEFTNEVKVRDASGE